VSSTLPASCIDLKDDSFTTGDAIYMWPSGSGHGLGWNLAKAGTVGGNEPFVAGSGLNTTYNTGTTQSYIYVIEKTLASGGHDGCLTATGEYLDTMEWEPCDTTITNGGTTTDADLWVQTTTGEFINVGSSNLEAGSEGTGCSPGCAEALVAQTPLSKGSLPTVNPMTTINGDIVWSVLQAP
jgi:hypothetical protein